MNGSLSHALRGRFPFRVQQLHVHYLPLPGTPVAHKGLTQQLEARGGQGCHFRYLLLVPPASSDNRTAFFSNRQPSSPTHPGFKATSEKFLRQADGAHHLKILDGHGGFVRLQGRTTAVYVYRDRREFGSTVMTPRIVCAEDESQLMRLYEQHALAAMRASAVLVREGMQSAKFKEADKAAGKAWRQVRTILGDTNSYWT